MENCKFTCFPTRSRPRKFTAKDVNRIINNALLHDSEENVCAAIKEAMQDEIGDYECNQVEQIDCKGFDLEMNKLLNQINEVKQNPAIEISMEKLEELKNFGINFWNNIFSLGGLLGNPDSFKLKTSSNDPNDPVVIDDQGNIVSGTPPTQGTQVLLPFVWPAAWLGTLFMVLDNVKGVIEYLDKIRELIDDLKEAEIILKEFVGLLNERCKK